MPVNLKNQKEEKRATLLRAHGLPKTTRAIVVSFVQDAGIQAFLTLACSSLGIVLLTEKNEVILAGADAWITDTLDESIPVSMLFQQGVVPIVPKENPHKKLFSEFNPMKFEGNAFVFEHADEYQMFASLVRYLENVRYPGDKRTLLKNVSETSL